MKMFKTFAIGLVIYLVWKVAEGFFSGTKTPKEQRSQKPENQSRDNSGEDGFTDYEEVE